MPETLKTYIPAIDWFKLLMAIFVIGIHTQITSTINDLAIKKVVDAIFETAVPFFLISSGYFLYHDIFGTSSDSKIRITRYWLKIARMYVVWTIIFLPSTIYSYIAEGLSLKQALFNFCRGFLLVGEHTYSWPLWYLLALLVTICIINILKKLTININWIFTISVTLYISGILLNQIHRTALNDTCLVQTYFKFFINTRNGFFIGIFYFCLGMAIRRFCIIPQLWISMTYAIIGIALSACGIGWFGYPVSALAIFFIAIKIPDNDIIKKYASCVRKMSIIIYLSHMLILTPIYISGIQLDKFVLFMGITTLMLMISWNISKYSNTRLYKILF